MSSTAEKKSTQTDSYTNGVSAERGTSRLIHRWHWLLCIRTFSVAPEVNGYWHTFDTIVAASINCRVLTLQMNLMALPMSVHQIGSTGCHAVGITGNEIRERWWARKVMRSLEKRLVSLGMAAIYGLMIWRHLSEPAQYNGKNANNQIFDMIAWQPGLILYQFTC